MSHVPKSFRYYLNGPLFAKALRVNYFSWSWISIKENKENLQYNNFRHSFAEILRKSFFSNFTSLPLPPSLLLALALSHIHTLSFSHTLSLQICWLSTTEFSALPKIPQAKNPCNAKILCFEIAYDRVQLHHTYLEKKCQQQDSNSRPLVQQSAVLSTTPQWLDGNDGKKLWLTQHFWYFLCMAKVLR